MELLDGLDAVPSGCLLHVLEIDLHLLRALLPLYGSLLVAFYLLHLPFLVFILLEESALGVRRARRGTHERGVALGGLFDPLDVRVPAVVRQVAEDIDTLLPVQLERVGPLVVNVVLYSQFASHQLAAQRGVEGKPTHLDRHLVDVDPLLDSKVLHDDVERLVENGNDVRLPLDGSVALGEVGDEGAQEEVLALLLGELGGRLLLVAVLCDLRDCLRVHEEARLGCCDMPPNRQLVSRKDKDRERGENSHFRRGRLRAACAR